MKRALVLLVWLSASTLAGALPRPIELHQRLDEPAQWHARTVALTLDACGGSFDEGLIDFLVEHRTLARPKSDWSRAAGGAQRAV